jgi:hypothetical protein
MRGTTKAMPIMPAFNVVVNFMTGDSGRRFGDGLAQQKIAM